MLPFGEWKSHWILLYYALMIVLGKLYWNGFSKSFLIILLILGTLSLFTGRWFGDPYYQLHMINVGHGMAMLLQSPDKTTNILFDAGYNKQKENDGTLISDYLKRFNVWKLDAIFISHHHTDHYNNLQHLNEEFVVERVIQNQIQKPFYEVEELLFKNLPFDYYQTMQEENNRSLILQFVLEKQNFLLTFDAESPAERKLLQNTELQKTTFLQVGHHGSKTSSSSEFIEVLAPKYCFISNKWKTITKQMLQRKKCQTYSTNQNGNLIARITKNQIVVLTEKNTLEKRKFFTE